MALGGNRISTIWTLHRIFAVKLRRHCRKLWSDIKMQTAVDA